MHADADVRAVGEADLEARLPASHVEAVGVGERLRVAVRACERDLDEVAVRDVRTAEADVERRVAVDDGCGRLET